MAERSNIWAPSLSKTSRAGFETILEGSVELLDDGFVPVDFIVWIFV